MASFSSATRELVLKLVYYGPGLGGKTTSLNTLHGTVRPEHRGKMVSLATPVDRTLYFDFLPVRLPSVGEMQIRLQLFTVPGQVYFNATRKLVLTGADGIVFVADSQVARLDANIESLTNLRDNLAELGRSIEAVPLVLAYNKRDLSDVLTVEELDRELNPFGAPAIGTSAVTGSGLFESLDAVVRLSLDDLRRRRIIPADVQIPSDGLVRERLSDVQAPTAVAVQAVRVVGDASPPPRSNSSSSALRALAPPESAFAASIGSLQVDEAPPAARVAPTIPVSLPAVMRSTEASSATVRLPVDAFVRNAKSEPPAPFVAPARTGAAPPAAPQVVEESPPAPPVSADAGAAAPESLSLTDLFDADEQDAARSVEMAIVAGANARAAVLLDGLFTRVCDAVARELGRENAPLESLAWAAGVPAERYVRLRTLARRAREGSDPARSDVLDAYVTVALCARWRA